jgi:hypothetical protein
MGNPHVVALYYRLGTVPNFSFRDPDPVERETDAFTMRVADGVVTFQMKTHYASEQEAKQKVQPYLEAWDVTAGLEFGRKEVWFEFDHSDIIDRNRPPGYVLHAEPGSYTILAADTAPIRLSAERATVHVTRVEYPSHQMGL